MLRNVYKLTKKNKLKWLIELGHKSQVCSGLNFMSLDWLDPQPFLKLNFNCATQS